MPHDVVIDSIRANVHGRLEVDCRNAEAAMEIGLVGLQRVQDGPQPGNALRMDFQYRKGQSQDIVDEMV